MHLDKILDISTMERSKKEGQEIDLLTASFFSGKIRTNVLTPPQP